MRKIFIKPCFWIGVYVVTILLFAWIYSINSSDFYHSNIAYERDYLELVDQVKDSLYIEIKNMMDFNNEEAAYYLDVPDTNYAISVDEVVVLRYDPVNIAFDVMVPLLNNNPINEDTTSTFVKYNVVYTFQWMGTKYVTEDNVVLATYSLAPLDTITNSITSEETIDDVDISKALGGDDWIISIPVSSELDDMILTLIKSEYGYTDGYESNFARMLYLSTVTITTLGFGDIVPITDFARLLIGLESILGVVILSLFINALFHEIVRMKVNESHIE